MSEYVALAKRWAEVTKLVAAGSWEGILCPKNGDADVLIEKRSWDAGNDVDNRRYEYWIHCPRCGAEIFFRSRHKYRPRLNEGGLTTISADRSSHGGITKPGLPQGRSCAPLTTT